MPSGSIGKSALAAALACLLIPSTARAGPLGAAGGYGEFVFGNLTRNNASSNGAIAAGGSATINNMSIRGSDAAGLVVGGDLSWHGGSLGSGTAYVGGKASTRNVWAPGGVKGDVDVLPVDFTSAQAYLEGFSLAQYGDANAKASYDGYYWYSLGATDGKGLQVVDVDASALRGKGVRVAGQSGSTVIVNVLGDSASFSNMQVQLAGGITASNVLWNFVDATSLKLANVGWAGTILAPHAAVAFDNGQLSGALIAAALKGTGTIDIGAGGASLFAGDARAFAPASPTPEPAGIVMLGVAAAAGLAASVARRRWVRGRRAGR
ncbi:choice-of-anchor A family protein [Paludisphaera sp.]|uniref:choice-of-anchor A family protein n=1 Tax=Paludisphaera sp. TaxID=2017432 RepID=UPI00301CA058